MSERREVHVGVDDDGREVRVPVVNLLTGRGFVTGKSGSGKSNTASVIAEELLEAGYPLLIVDTDGEYYGLKEAYEMLHAGADEECDIQVGPEHAEQVATLALEENVPVILDVSGYLDEEVANDLLRKTARQLFVKEKKLKKPFLLIVEEVHEYLPEKGGGGETGKMLIKIGKRGRKHGLGILGISQRPADVKKDFITQANWLVWHRLTWDNDTKVVGRIMGSEYADAVSGLEDGQAFVQTDWSEDGVRRIQFRRKHTFDAGATPGLDDFERPELKSVSDALVGDLQEISDRKEREQDRIQELEAELEEKEIEIADLKDQLASAQDVSDAAKQMARALSDTTPLPADPAGQSDELRRLHEELVDLERERDDLAAERDELIAERDEIAAERDDLAAERDELEAELEWCDDRIETLATENERLRARLDGRPADGLEADSDLSASGAEAEPAVEVGASATGTEAGPSAEGRSAESLDGGPILEAEADGPFGYRDEPGIGSATDILDADEEWDADALVDDADVGDRFAAACADSQCDEEAGRRLLEAIVTAGPLRAETAADRVGRSTIAVQSLLSELRTRDLLDRAGTNAYAPSDRLGRVVSAERIE